MENQSEGRIEVLFHAARERAAGAERCAYLDGACGNDGDLRARVDALLAAHDEAAGFLESPALERPGEAPGASIGPYKLLQEIGEGGMGIVYMAEQEKPVTRKVALKVIKLGMDTKQVIARFEAERQALAMMDHPHIARVLDAGATETGRPYFVMELVRGVAIDAYCDTHKLPTGERLALFAEVCRAVQHAHQKGVIHRDLKPNNVLITSHDGRPVPKIIDFGVAKATNQKLTERTLFTEFRQIIGTPEYMSPEQAEMSGLDVDTRSDIYSLGVLLYQLLTGTTPVDPGDLRTAGFEEMTRLIREEEPHAPSTRISKLGADAESIARSRRSDAGALSRRLRGDLDWIVMKALEKDRTRRYETAAAFAQDVQRHLDSRPVEAGRPGAGYRLAKFARRNRKAAAAGALLALVLGLGLLGTTAGFLRARSEADRSSAISASLQDVLALSGPAPAGDAGEVERVLDDVRATFGEQHATLAAVLDTFSMQLRDAGEFERAEELCREALDVWRRAHGDEHLNVALTRARLGSLLRVQGAEDEAESELRAALATLAGDAQARGPAVHNARLELADLVGSRGAFDEADAILGEALDALRTASSVSRFRIIEALESRLVVQLNAGSPAAGETLREIYDETHDFYPEESLLRAVSAMTLGNYLLQHGDGDEAEPYLREAVERFRSGRNPRSPYSVASHDSLFQLLRQRQDPESIREADEVLGQTIELARGYWSEEHYLGNLDHYAGRLLEHGRPADALALIREAHQISYDRGDSLEERERFRDGMAYIAFRVAASPGAPAEDYAAAREAAETALTDEPEHPVMQVALAAALFREGDFERSGELLDGLQAPLSQVGGGLARRASPGDRAFAALVHARLGRDERAREELAALRAALEHQDADGLGPALLAEAEALIEPRSAGAADG
ncbi:MAG: serine/threonine-protein kinase [Planctomycetota bacterium]